MSINRLLRNSVRYKVRNEIEDDSEAKSLKSPSISAHANYILELYHHDIKSGIN